MPTPTSFSHSENFVYEGRDLEAMAWAPNYYNWILDYFRPYIGERLLEVGAGSGSFSLLLHELYKKELWMIEPSAPTYTKLQEKLRTSQIPVNHSYHGMLSQHANLLKTKEIDTIFYINVLEHVQNDVAELTHAYHTLKPGGHVLTFSPALPALYGKFDKRIGHYRRYTLSEMKQKMTEAGFKVATAHYFDIVGMVGWWVKFKLMQSDIVSTKDVALFDTYIVPFIRTLEPSAHLPIGKNVLVVGKKPSI